MEKENFIMSMVIFLKVLGKMTKLMELAFINMLMEQLIMENGKMIYSMDLGQRHGLIIADMKEIMKMGKNKDKAHIFGQMGIQIF